MSWAVSILSAERLRSGVCTPREGALMAVGGSQGLQKLRPQSGSFLLPGRRKLQGISLTRSKPSIRPPAWHGSGRYRNDSWRDTLKRALLCCPGVGGQAFASQGLMLPQPGSREGDQLLPHSVPLVSSHWRPAPARQLPGPWCTTVPPSVYSGSVGLCFVKADVSEKLASCLISPSV